MDPNDLVNLLIGGPPTPLKQKRGPTYIPLYSLIYTPGGVKNEIMTKGDIREDIKNMSDEDAVDYLRLKYKLAVIEKSEKAHKDFLFFVKEMWPEFIEGRHHKVIAKKFNKIAQGKLKRLIINMPPRHTKSEFASNFLPAWMVGINPKLKIIQTTHNTELAIRFGRKAKSMIDTEEYQNFFSTKLKQDSQAAGKWETSQGGEYYAAGVGSAITGRGADLLIIDDPHSEQDALNPEALEKAYEWYTSGPRQRLQPGGVIVVVMTRWSIKDLTQKLMEAQAKDPKADQWELVEFPAIMDNEKPLWPEFWKQEELEGVRASLSVPKWNAQWMQNPTSEEGAIIKREWWRIWESEDIPVLKHIIQSYDTAFSKKENADYSAITTWGVFNPDSDGPDQLILLDSLKGRYDFPDLRRKALEQYNYWKPETVVIESKASGLPLTHELRQMGIPVVNYSPNRGNDKYVRVNACSPLFESGMIWAPNKRFAEEVIEECAAFPYGDHDDLVDSTTQAVRRFREGGFVSHPEDYKDDEITEPSFKRDMEYY